MSCRQRRRRVRPAALPCCSPLCVAPTVPSAPQLTPACLLLPLSLPPAAHCAYLDRSDSLQAACMGSDDAAGLFQQHGAPAAAAHPVDLARIVVQGAPWGCDMVDVLMAEPIRTVPCQ